MIFFLFQEVAEEVEFTRQIHFHVTYNLMKYLLSAFLVRTLPGDHGNSKQCKELVSWK